MNIKRGYSVAILLGTYNGERFLEAQLDSLESQTARHWKLYVSDDGSTDATLDIIQRYQSKWSADKIQYQLGPQKGFAQNFLSLACDPDIKADYFAFCDQDDVWLPEKIERCYRTYYTRKLHGSVVCIRR